MFLFINLLLGLGDARNNYQQRSKNRGSTNNLKTVGYTKCLENNLENQHSFRFFTFYSCSCALIQDSKFIFFLNNVFDTINCVIRKNSPLILFNKLPLKALKRVNTIQSYARKNDS